jgi:hypothetical protein
MTPLKQDPYGSGDKPTEYDKGKRASPGRSRSAWCVAIAAVVLALLVVWLNSGLPD